MKHDYPAACAYLGRVRDAERHVEWLRERVANLRMLLTDTSVRLTDMPHSNSPGLQKHETLHAEIDEMDREIAAAETGDHFRSQHDADPAEGPPGAARADPVLSGAETVDRGCGENAVQHCADLSVPGRGAGGIRSAAEIGGLIPEQTKRDTPMAEVSFFLPEKDLPDGNAGSSQFDSP